MFNKIMNVAMVAVAAIGISVVYDMVVEDFALYTSESACVSGFINDGYERASITTGNGTCWIK